MEGSCIFMTAKKTLYHFLEIIRLITVQHASKKFQLKLSKLWKISETFNAGQIFF